MLSSTALVQNRYTLAILKNPEQHKILFIFKHWVKNFPVVDTNTCRKTESYTASRWHNCSSNPGQPYLQTYVSGQKGKNYIWQNLSSVKWDNNKQ